MTSPRIGAVVRCGDLIAGVYPAVASLLAGTTPALSVAVVADSTTPRSADPWLSAFAAGRRLLFVRVETPGPGGAWNAGLGAIGPADFAVCLHSGETLERSALEILARRLSSDPSLALVTSGIEWIGPGTRRRFSSAPGCSVLDILADPAAVHASSLFRWPQWQSSSGFDEDIPALEHADFWLKLLESGGTAAAESRPLLRRPVHARALYRRTWTTGHYVRAARTLYERHGQVAGASPGALLQLKERVVLKEYLRYRDSQGRLREGEQEIARLTAVCRDLLADVPQQWRPAVDFGALARTTPLSYNWGYDRGTPADRPFIEQYLAAHASDIRGVVLEIQEDDYARRFGGNRVARSDVLDVDVSNPRATLIGDLRAMQHVGSATYDCIILTQTLHVIDDMPAVVRERERLLRPNGVLLATLPAASRVCLEYGPEGDFWRVTEGGARRLFTDVFPPADVDTTAFGNPLVNAAFGFGLASEDLPAGAYDAHDAYFPMLIGVRARKAPVAEAGRALGPRRSGICGAALLYHRVGGGAVDPHRLSISASTLRTQLDWLCSTCSVVPLEQLALDPGALPPRAVALTFDDGYVDNLSVALPLLRDARVSATFFLTSGDGAAPYHYWWDRLVAALVTPGPVSLTIELASGRRELATSTAEERLAAHWLIYQEVVRLPAASRDAIVDQIFSWAGTPELDARNRRLTWPEVRELTSEPAYSIGAHTVEHLFLPAQPDSVLKSELLDNRATLQCQTGATVESLAYPFGAVDKRTVTAARRAGFRLAVTCEERGVRASDDPLALPRVEVTEGPLDGFVARIEEALRG